MFTENLTDKKGFVVNSLNLVGGDPYEVMRMFYTLDSKQFDKIFVDKYGITVPNLSEVKILSDAIKNKQLEGFSMVDFLKNFKLTKKQISDFIKQVKFTK